MPSLIPMPGRVPPSPEGAVPALSDVHHVLSEYHAFAAIAAAVGAADAEAETGAPLHVHAVRLAAALAELLAENVLLRELAEGAR